MEMGTAATASGVTDPPGWRVWTEPYAHPRRGGSSGIGS